MATPLKAQGDLDLDERGRGQTHRQKKTINMIMLNYIFLKKIINFSPECCLKWSCDSRGPLDGGPVHQGHKEDRQPVTPKTDNQSHTHTGPMDGSIHGGERAYTGVGGGGGTRGPRGPFELGAFSL